MKVVIVGSGNVATVLGKKIALAGHNILQVISKNEDRGEALAQLFGCDFSYRLINANRLADLYMLAVPDKNIAGAAGNLPQVKGILVHTAGSVSINVLLNRTAKCGVIYPLQTLNRHIEELPEVPVLIDGSGDEVSSLVDEFASSWAMSVKRANDDLRLHTHLAAVMTNNFTNHLMALTQDYCRKEGVDFELLFPLIKQTIKTLEGNSAFDLQTGPAARNDIFTIEKHLQLLHKQPELRKLYLKLSESIISHSHKNAS